MRSYILSLLLLVMPFGVSAQAICPQYVRLCPDGHSTVRPDPNNDCQVPACPGESSSSSSEPVYCTQEAMLCPDGHTYVGRDSNNNCQFSPCPGVSSSSSSAMMCMPYMCEDGTQVPRCTADGTPIEYFAAPCMTHGGEVEPGSSASSNSSSCSVQCAQCSSGEMCPDICWSSCSSAGQSFSDVPASYPYADAIAYLKAQGIVEGYADGTFRPNKTINRAEFTKIVMNAIYSPPELDNCLGRLLAVQPKLFSDVESNVWYSKFICMAKSGEHVSGYPDGTFRPGQTINFAEAAKILALAFHLDVHASAGNDPWYRVYIDAMAQVNAIPLTITSPGQPLVRSEMAEMIFRLATGNNDKQSQTYDSIAGDARVASSSYNPAAVQVGQKVGAMTVSSVTSTGIDFVGQVTVTGQFQEESTSASTIGPISVCFDHFDSATLAVFPFAPFADDGNAHFCLSPSEELSQFPRYSSGTATIVIDQFHLNLTPGEFENSAHILSVQSVTVAK